MSDDDYISQDQDVPVEPPAPLRTFLALMRIVAGFRGHSRFVWSGQGFVYDLHVYRGDEVPRLLDVDDNAVQLETARDRLNSSV